MRAMVILTYKTKIGNLENFSHVKINFPLQNPGYCTYIVSYRWYKQKTWSCFKLKLLS